MQFHRSFRRAVPLAALALISAAPFAAAQQTVTREQKQACVAAASREYSTSLGDIAVTGAELGPKGGAMVHLSVKGTLAHCRVSARDQVREIKSYGTEARDKPAPSDRATSRAQEQACVAAASRNRGVPVGQVDLVSSRPGSGSGAVVTLNVAGQRADCLVSANGQVSRIE
ncbi:hypothetical protein FDP22_18840 (plasmid) [Paroceanicella profunda]|uniref:DUF3617 family protein n=1 Tax=Paroceanicella profunda TaxID=2579971 RepID=A0A5B8G1M9_9RHOB|nr:hypothetical protein [Paroceanicella profunda]QDL93934.1 hypothetical protein FDP22_18840 [Paroceanicella profunda]